MPVLWDGNGIRAVVGRFPSLHVTHSRQDFAHERLLERRRAHGVQGFPEPAWTPVLEALLTLSEKLWVRRFSAQGRFLTFAL